MALDIGWNPTRRVAIMHGVVAAGLWQGRAGAQGARFSHASVVERAKALALGAFDNSLPAVPEAFLELGYDAYRAIRFRRDHALLGPPGAFRMELLHPGFLFKRTVAINAVVDGTVEPVVFDAGMFDYGAKESGAKGASAPGFAGFRLMYPLNKDGVFDEIVSFLGASYFRFLGKGDRYGLSTRALAIGVGGSDPEEFPFFREFWIEQPAPAAVEIVVHALLDSPSLAGAYRFALRPAGGAGLTGAVVDVSATLFTRQPVSRMGIAPMTSMYFSGENDVHRNDDFRPELHDSDGLLVHNGAGEWLWRPLRNPPSISLAGFVDKNPRGFGLLQRDHDFGHYLDLEAPYHMRPSYWVEPAGEWGAGRVELVEIPSGDETNDNVNAYWTPDKPVGQGERVEFAYAITAATNPLAISPRAVAVATYQTNTKVVGTPDPVRPGERRFLVDFAGGALAGSMDTDLLQAVASCTKGAILRTFVIANPQANGVRAGFDVALEPGELTELRLFLQDARGVLSETWTYPWSRSKALAAAEGDLPAARR